MSLDEKNYTRTEIVAGLFVLVGIGYLIYVAIGLGKTSLGANGYVLYADFVSVSGLNVGDPVKIAGVKIGTVESISLADYRARVALRLQDNITIHHDAIASIESGWLIGDRLVSIDPGSTNKLLGPGDEIEETESPVSLQYLLGKWIAGDLT